MKIIKNIILLIPVLLASCTFKSKHHITIEHNIKLKIDPTTRESFLDKLRSSQNEYNDNMLAVKEKYMQSSLDVFVNELYNDIE